MSNKCGCLSFNPIALGLAIGVVTGVFMMALAWVAWAWNIGTAIVQQQASLFPGFEASLYGGFYGLGWGILLGFVFGLILGIIYNIFLCCRSCCCCCCKSAGSP